VAEVFAGAVVALGSSLISIVLWDSESEHWGDGVDGVFPPVLVFFFFLRGRPWAIRLAIIPSAIRRLLYSIGVSPGSFPLEYGTDACFLFLFSSLRASSSLCDDADDCAAADAVNIAVSILRLFDVPGVGDGILIGGTDSWLVGVGLFVIIGVLRIVISGGDVIIRVFVKSGVVLSNPVFFFSVFFSISIPFPRVRMK